MPQKYVIIDEFRNNLTKKYNTFVVKTRDRETSVTVYVKILNDCWVELYGRPDRFTIISTATNNEVIGALVYAHHEDMTVYASDTAIRMKVSTPAINLDNAVEETLKAHKVVARRTTTRKPATRKTVTRRVRR